MQLRAVTQKKKEKKTKMAPKTLKISILNQNERDELFLNFVKFCVANTKIKMFWNSLRTALLKVRIVPEVSSQTSAPVGL